MAKVGLDAAYDSLRAILAPALGDSVAADPRKLKPGQLVRLLNSTPLGEVTSDRRLREHRERAGNRVGDDKSIDLLRYAAWLAGERHAAMKPAAAAQADPPPNTQADDPYEAMKRSAAARNRRLSFAGRDIGGLPPVLNPARKARAKTDLRFFLETYFPQQFSLAWSEDHLTVIARMQTCVLAGGLFALAMPRGAGKTTICERCCLWATCNGHRDFVMLIGSDETTAEERLDAMKMELETNDLLAEDYPEVTYPIQCLDGIANRCSGQLHQGRRTHIVWTAREVVLPTIVGRPASAAIIRVAGLTGRIRGAKFMRPDGKSVRPSLVVLDDPQTDESAASPSQSAKREAIIDGAVLGMAGPGSTIAAIMPCTIIRKADLADSMLDRTKHPQWLGETMKMVYAWPKAEGKWAKYAEVWAESLRKFGDHRLATDMYREDQAAMDEGAVLAWPARFNPDEISAVQHAWNLRLKVKDHAFFAEYQNEPVDESASVDDLVPDEIARRTNGLVRGMVPLACSHVTAFIDVHDKALYWVAAAFGDGFTGSVVNYGTWPDQQRHYFTLADCRRTIALQFPSHGAEGRIYDALERCADELFDREWTREDGVVMKVSAALVDAGWGPMSETVKKWTRETKHAAIIKPSHGRGIGPADSPMEVWKTKPGEKIGLHWVLRTNPARRAVRLVEIDVNWWKSFMAARITTARGDSGALTLFGKEGQDHRLFADHCCAERRIRTVGEKQGRVVDMWKLPPHRPDNHYWDCLVGAAVAANMQGITLAAVQPAKKKRKRINLAELQRLRRAGR